MRLTVVGAGPAYADRPGAVGACYVVESGDTAVVLDLGHGAFAGLASRLDPARLDAVLVSHLHPDHFVDLVPLRHYLRYERPPGSRVRVHAPIGLDARLAALVGEPGFVTASLDLMPVPSGPFRVGVLEIESTRVMHTDESYGFRVAGPSGGALVYSGDLGAAEDLAPLVRPGDTLLIEASFGPGPNEAAARHLDGMMVGRFAGVAGVGVVLLTHILPGRDLEATVAAVRAGFAGPVTIVEPGFVTEI